MGLVGLAPALVMAALGAGPDAPPSSTSPPSSPIFTRQTLFSIPFRLDPKDPAARDVAEVHLYVSNNRGATWRFYNRAEPQRGSFLFRAGGDGEYWFLLRTVDRAGTARPETTREPGLKVVVDTTVPQLTLEARPGQSGQVTAQWHIVDPNVSPQTLRIQYRNGPYQPWQAVAIDRQRTAASGPDQTGEVSWLPQGASGRLEIRGEVSDLAGNTAVSHAQVGLETGVAPDAKPAGPLALNPPAPGPGVPLAGPQTTSREGPPPAAGEGPVAIQIRPASRNRYVTSGTRGDATASELVPPGRRLRMVNSLRFELDYELQPASLSASTVVQVWGTRDGGQTWRNLGTDEDRRTPFPATVPGEGVYGFRLVLGDKAGPGERPPAAGSPAELWVGVDLTQPQVRILAAELLAGPQAGQVDIRWEAEDLALAPRPISLFYGPGPDGPWTLIASGLEDTGQYVWWMDGRVPERVYLRLEARDEAGNVGVCVTPEPVRVDRQRAGENPRGAAGG